MLGFPFKRVTLRKSAVLCESLRFGLSVTFSSVPLSSPRFEAKCFNEIRSSAAVQMFFFSLEAIRESAATNLRHGCALLCFQHSFFVG